MRLYLVLGALLVVCAGGVFYHFLYPPGVMKRNTDEALQQVARAMAGRDRAEISRTLGALLADDAHIRLDVDFSTIGRQVPVVVQEFDKNSFIAFIDNLLYPLTDFGFAPKLEEFEPSEDRSEAGLRFFSTQWGDGTSHYGGLAVGVRFTSTADCVGKARFGDKKPQLAGAQCAVMIRQAPRPGEAQKLQQNPEAMRDLLR